jgi:predicted nucleic acid-binding protein
MYATLLGMARKIYLETTMFNFPFADDAPGYTADTRRLFDEIKAGKFEPYTSWYVTEELDKTKNECRRKQMSQLVDDCGAYVLDATEEIERLAAIYIAEGVIPATHGADALHIATAAVNRLDAIISLNFNHIVKAKTIEMTETINYRMGYRKVSIYSPAEVIDYDTEL